MRVTLLWVRVYPPSPSRATFVSGKNESDPPPPASSWIRSVLSSLVYRPNPVTSKLPADWAAAADAVLRNNARESPRTRIPHSGCLGFKSRIGGLGTIQYRSRAR